MLKRLFGLGRPADGSTTATEAAFDEMLRRVAGERHPFAIVHLDDGRNWYLQVTMVDTALLTEAVSNAHLTGDNRLSAEVEAELRQLGWDQASAQDNWARTWPGWPDDNPGGPRDLLLASLPLYRRAVGDRVIIEFGD